MGIDNFSFVGVNLQYRMGILILAVVSYLTAKLTTINESLRQRKQRNLQSSPAFIPSLNKS
jgi:hypothetical protein